MNRPREVLFRACIEDVLATAENLQKMGWPVEVIAVDEPDFYGVRVQIDLGAIPVPVEVSA